jgi:hypothetical protein
MSLTEVFVQNSYPLCSTEVVTHKVHMYGHDSVPIKVIYKIGSQGMTLA